MNIANIRDELERRKGQRKTVEENLERLKKSATESRRQISRHEKAREILREVGRQTQEQLQYHIGDITSLALEAVFEDPYALVVDFVTRRNKTECDLFFARDGEMIDPVDASGGGAVDVAAFALRVASWSMESPRSRPVIILDEPFRMLDVQRQERAAPMLKEISEKLGIQFIIVTHEPILSAFADKVFETKIRNGITQIS